jgi:hypothetical protein
MKPILSVLATLIFLPAAVFPQDVPPPPKPADDGPSLEVTMKFIEEKLGAVGRVSYIAYVHNNKDGSDETLEDTDEITNVRAGVADCRIDFHWSNKHNDEAAHEADAWFLLKGVQEVVVTSWDRHLNELKSKGGHPEWVTTRVDPPVSQLVIKFKRDWTEIALYDESLANRIAKALVHAVELCGGGNKDPF